MNFSFDLALFFVDFGVDVVVGGIACRGIFDNQYIESLGYSAGLSPVLLVRSSDVSNASQGNAVLIGEVNYVIAEIEPDGTGITLLRLHHS